jgi:hypothetical protein
MPRCREQPVRATTRLHRHFPFHQVQLDSLILIVGLFCAGLFLFA